MITPRPAPNDSTPKPGFPMIPFFGIEPVLMSDDVRPYIHFYNYGSIYHNYMSIFTTMDPFI